jgi:hypothetical protein
MKKVILVLALFAIAFAFSACSDSTLTGVDEKQTSNIPVPFKGSFVGTAITIGTNNMPYPTLKEMTFSGNASHVGNYSCVYNYIIYINPNVMPPGVIIEDPDPVDAVLTAANGDEIWFDNSVGGWWFRNGNPYIAGYVDGSVHIEVVGGTGRFADATGFIDVVIVQEYDPVEDPTPGTGTWTGQIMY